MGAINWHTLVSDIMDLYSVTWLAMLDSQLTLFCENYYSTKKITNLQRKLLFCEEKVGSKSKKVGSKSTLLICAENYHFAKKITILQRKLLFF